jgi:flagellin-specific chaperone FliS
MDREGIDAYKRTQVMGCSPGQLVLVLYDHILGCLRKSDMRGASKGLVELMSALDLDYQEVSGRLFSLYEYCLDLVKKQKYEEAGKILAEMRAMWATAMKNMTRDGSAAEGTED